MGMTVQEFWHITPRSFYNKLTGYRRTERDSWEQVRFIMWSGLVPYGEKNKPITVQSVLPLPWDNDLKEKNREDVEQKRKNAQDTWAKIDSKKSNVEQ